MEMTFGGPVEAEKTPRKRAGRPAKSEDERKRHYGAVYFLIREILYFLRHPRTSAEITDYVNNVVLPRTEASALEPRAVFRIIRDLRGLSLHGAPKEEQSEEVIEPWRAFVATVAKRGRHNLFQVVEAQSPLVDSDSVIAEAISKLANLYAPSPEAKAEIENLVVRLGDLNSRLSSGLVPSLPLFGDQYWAVANTPFKANTDEYKERMPELLKLLEAIQNQRVVSLTRLNTEGATVVEEFCPYKMALCEDSLYVIGERANIAHCDKVFLENQVPLERVNAFKKTFGIPIDPNGYGNHLTADEPKIEYRSFKRIQSVELTHATHEGYRHSPKAVAKLEDFFRHRFGASLPECEADQDPLQFAVQCHKSWVKGYLLGLGNLDPVDLGAEMVQLTAYPSESLECWLRGRLAMGDIGLPQKMWWEP